MKIPDFENQKPMTIQATSGMLGGRPVLLIAYPAMDVTTSVDAVCVLPQCPDCGNTAKFLVVEQSPDALSDTAGFTRPYCGECTLP